MAGGVRSIEKRWEAVLEINPSNALFPKKCPLARPVTCHQEIRICIHYHNISSLWRQVSANIGKILFEIDFYQWTQLRKKKKNKTRIWKFSLSFGVGIPPSNRRQLFPNRLMVHLHFDYLSCGVFYQNNRNPSPICSSRDFSDYSRKAPVAMLVFEKEYAVNI